MSNQELSNSVSFIISDESNVLCILNPYEPIVVSLLTYKVQVNEHWTVLIKKELTELLGASNIIRSTVQKLTKIYVPLPKEEKSIINIIVYIKVSPTFRNYFVVPQSPQYANLKWLNDRDLARFYNLKLVASPVLLEVFPRLEIDRFVFSLTNITGIHECEGFVELSSEVFAYETENRLLDELVEESTLKSLKKLIYLEFIKIIHPQIVMASGHFTQVVSKLGFSKQDAPYLFKAADIANRSFLSFNEFLGICAAMEPSCKNTGMSGKARSFYIFRFFNRKNPGQLILQELKEIILVTRRARQLTVDAVSVEKELKETALALNVSTTRAVNVEEFVKCSSEGRIRGLANIFRNSKSISSLVPNAAVPARSSEMRIRKFKSAIPASVERAVKNVVQWEAATHLTKIVNSGTHIDIDSLFSLSVCSPYELEAAAINKVNRQKSIDTFSPQSLCNEILQQLRQLTELNTIKSGNRGNLSRDYNWGTINRKQYAQKLASVFSIAKDILSNEPRLLSCVMPIYILGDFHGNFGDLLSFEKLFWPLNIEFNPASMLFLGDYVDRGGFGVEVVTYLLCNKILHPKKFFLVRGNHEIREVQQMYTFYTECVAKFGDNVGKAIWDAINVCFDFMPLAAVIENKIFCCHGGIPPPWLGPSISSINQIPKPLPDPSSKSVLAWDLLWNDPVKDKHITKEMSIEMAANDGFAANPKRGTAHVFNKTATFKFLAANDLSHIIRAHEMVFAGVALLHKGKVISVFSSSRYNEASNEAACILLDDHKMQIFRLNTNTTS